MPVRRAETAHLDAMIRLIEARRIQLERWQPTFWRRAEGAAAMSRAWFAHLLNAPDALVLVAETDGAVAGMLIARHTPAPPVYRPGDTWTVDDFCVSEPALWSTVGAALLAEVGVRGREAGWAQVVVIGVASDVAQAAMLLDGGASVASTWSTIALETLTL